MYPITDARFQELQNSFIYHSPKPDQIPRYQELRQQALELAINIEKLVPPGRCKSIAQTKLEEVVMWASKGIGCQEA